MAENASYILVQTLIEWGVDTVFGLPGDGINGVIEALRVKQDTIRFIQVRHEEAAAFMACGYAKYTGRLGCCLATSGPGGIHLLNGLYDAKLDQAPVIAITGQTFSDLQGSGFQQDVDLVSIFRDVAVYNQQIINPGQVKMLADEACRHALARRGVSHLNFPVDYQEKEPGKPSMHKRPGETSHIPASPIQLPPPADLRRAADLIDAAKRPVLLVGQGALKAGPEVIALAERIGAPIVKSLLGKAVLPDRHPLTTGGLGLLGTTPSQNAMEQCDLLLLIGTSFPYLEFLPKHDKAVGIQIDDRAERIGLRYPVEVGLVGDAKPTVAGLTALVQPHEDRSFLQERQKEMVEWWELMERQASQEAVPIKPQRVAWELARVANDDAIISGDSGTNTTWVARQFPLRDRQMFSCSGTLATMAPGLPYAIAAAAAFPGRQSLAFVGDGGFTMLMGEFATAVKYSLPICCVVLKNNSLGQIKWEQIVFLGNPEYVCDLQDIDYAKFAEACGGLGFTVTDPNELRPTFERALSSGRPSVVQVVIDPNEPPMPSRVTLQQAEHFAMALAKGTSGRGKIATTLFRDKLNEVI